MYIFQINITVRVDRSAGLGALGKSNEMSIGNIGVVNARRRYVQNQLRYTHASSGSDTTKKQSGPKLWVQGPTQENFDIGNEDSNKDEKKWNKLVFVYCYEVFVYFTWFINSFILQMKFTLYWLNKIKYESWFYSMQIKMCLLF